MSEAKQTAPAEPVQQQEDSGCPVCGSDAPSTLERQVNALDIFRCDACGLGFVPRQQLQESISYDDLYSPDGEYSHHLDEARQLASGNKTPLPRVKRTALEVIQDLGAKSVFEIGCGVGNFLAYVEELGIAASGIDSSQNAVDVARKHLSGTIECGLLDEQTFAGQTFDVVCCWEVIEHVIDVPAFTRIARDRLNDGGTFMLSTPNYASSWIWNDTPRDPRSQPPVHNTYWDEQSMRSYLERSGFSDVSVQHQSIPLNAARRSGGQVSSAFVVADCFLRSRQRSTLFARARKSATAAR